MNVKMKASTCVCLSSSLCSETFVPSFPCCAARKAKNRCHFTRTPENASCERENVSCVFSIRKVAVKHIATSFWSLSLNLA